MKNQFILKVLIGINIIFHVCSIHALDPGKHFDFHLHHVWTVEDGLPINSVIAITQTSDGYLWLGTETGLARFDGVDFDTYNHENTPQLTNDLILSLIGDGDGGLWIGTRGGGVVRLQQGGFTTFNLDNGLLSNEVWALMEAGDGSIWIGTRKGLNRFQRGTIERISLPENMSNHNVRALMEDRLGRVWAGTRGGGLIMIEKRGTRFETECKGMEDFKISALLQDQAGHIWIGTTERGLFRLQGRDAAAIDKNSHHVYTVKEGLSTNFIRCLMEDRGGNLWIGTYGGGICVKKNGSDKITVYNRRGDLSSNSIYSFYEDREGTFWIGTEGGGLNSLRESRIVTYTMKNGLTYDISTGVFQDNRGDIWISSMGFGVDCFDVKKNRFHVFNTANGLSSDSVVSIAEHPRDNLWLGTLGGGVNLLDLKTRRVRAFTTREGLSDNFVRALYVDTSGILWAGTDNGGLHRYSNGWFILYCNVKFRVNTIFKDSKGGLWVGTWGNGLCLLGEAGRIKIFNKKSGLSGNIVTSIYEDHKGVLWIGTYNHGLNLFRNGKFSKITRDHGLPDNTIYCILEDQKHYLWMSTNRGIVCTHHRDLENFLDGNSPRLETSLFTREDGMKSIECNGGNYPAGWRTRDGKLWFPTTKGVSVVNPENIGINAQPPPVQIKKVTIDGKDYDVYKNAMVPPGNGNLEIRFTGLSYIVSKKIRFKYRLEGYDKNWREGGTRRIAGYRDIPHGAYTFRVMACNSDGVWNNSGASFAFHLQPRYYQTMTFKIFFPLLLVFFILAAYFSVKKYRSIVKRRNKYRGSQLKPAKVEESVKKMLYLIEVEKIYKDADISLKSLSEKLSVSPRCLSQIINERMKKNFYELINNCRVQEAKKMLTSPLKQDCSILEIGYDVGFSSKSAFNRAFKHFTKLTPSQYRRRHKRSGS